MSRTTIVNSMGSAFRLSVATTDCRPWARRPAQTVHEPRVRGIRLQRHAVAPAFRAEASRLRNRILGVPEAPAVAIRHFLKQFAALAIVGRIHGWQARAGKIPLAPG